MKFITTSTPPFKTKGKNCPVSGYISNIFRLVGRQTFFFSKHIFLYGKSTEALRKGLKIDFNIPGGFEKV